ncbi:putative superfamily III holin-X [Pontibacter ummariensis]|uniref:Putative Holin-X, holin superfamily III n=1 Tax=Pontibacter ummariensis TaxID=1610492 RepID=A0A239CFC8_9BACT|nr:phage holin family protein [Pontibacter ummariensis]PRY15068.1 putative superfamily III holin-X [Pontibacter ummariensis]SNS18371.1 Putative Holin-X, holin superfamily III [Pontibacter ummariensis]
MAIQDNGTQERNTSLIENLMGYIDTRIDIIRLEIQEKLKASFVGLMHVALLAFAGFMSLIFVNIFLGLLLNELLDSTFWGFGIVALFYVLLLVVLLIGLDKKAFQGLADKTFDNTIYKSDKREPHV